MLRFLLEKEFKQLLRHPFLPKLILLFPLFCLLLFPWVADYEIKGIDVCVVDGDQSPMSQRLVRKIGASAYFRLVGTPQTYAQALAAVDGGEADLILELPRGFERRLVREGQSPALIAANSVNSTQGGMGSLYLSEILQEFSAELRADNIPSGRGDAAASFEIIPRYQYNPHFDYKAFMVPALMVMMLTLLCGFLPALNIVSEKEKGTIEQMNVTPVRRADFLLSKLIPYWCVGFVVLTLCIVVARLVYGLVPRGGLLTIYFFASIYVLAVSGLGLAVSNYARTLQQAMFMMFFFVLSLIFMSGLYTPIASMPPWAQALSTLSPIRSFAEVMRAIYLKGSAAGELRQPFWELCCFVVVLNGFALLSYRKRN